MAKIDVSSCPLCLQPEETASMLEVAFPHAANEGYKRAYICRSCATVISQAHAAREAEENPAPVDSEGKGAA